MSRFTIERIVLVKMINHLKPARGQRKGAWENMQLMACAPGREMLHSSLCFVTPAICRA